MERSHRDWMGLGDAKDAELQRSDEIEVSTTTLSDVCLVCYEELQLPNFDCGHASVHLLRQWYAQARHNDARFVLSCPARIDACQAKHSYLKTLREGQESHLHVRVWTR